MMATDCFQFPFISLSLNSFITFICFLPLFSFTSSVVIAIAWHYEESTRTVCHVPNYLPSISAVIGGNMPEKFIWSLGIALHCLPRIILFPLALHKYYRSTPLGQKYHSTTSWFWLLNLVACILQVVENGALLTLTFISSTDNFDVHTNSFIVFMICAMFYMFFSCILCRLTASQPMTSKEYTSLKTRVFIMLFNYSSFGLSVYFYFRHERYCEPGIYTLFALFEYFTVLSNIAFHWCCLDLLSSGAVVSLAYLNNTENNLSKLH